MANQGLRERKKERTRAEITRAALELFARDGFAATTINAIAEAANVSPRTVSTYFPAKEGIVFDAYESSLGRLEAALAERAADATLVDALEQWLRGEAERPAEDTSAIVRSGVESVDFARLREAAIARDPDLWARRRRRGLAVAELLTADAAKSFDPLAANVIGAAAVAALLELNAYVAQHGGGTSDSLDVVLGFLRGGLLTLEK
jgi:AcrR family transcriptional regulator